MCWRPALGCRVRYAMAVLKLTNLPWVLDSAQLRVDLKIEHVFLINDLEANGYGIPELSPGPDSCA